MKMKYLALGILILVVVQTYRERHKWLFLWQLSKEGRFFDFFKQMGEGYIKQKNPPCKPSDISPLKESEEKNGRFSEGEL